jgi:GTPase SAR1 family protein
VAITAVSSAKVAVVGSGEVGRTAVCRRYMSGPNLNPTSICKSLRH